MASIGDARSRVKVKYSGDGSRKNHERRGGYRRRLVSTFALVYKRGQNAGLPEEIIQAKED
jgi:hypothetical protein